MASSIGKVDIPEDLLCPECFELPDAEVYQCRDGHLLCSTCYFKLADCPQCRDPLDKYHPIRNRPIENILEGLQVSCTFKSNGCNKRLPKGSAKDHELGCHYDFKRFGELVSICKTIGHPKCQFNLNGGNISQAVEHFVTEHGCISTNSGTFKMELTSFKENAKVGGNGLQSWTPIIADLKERKCLLMTMGILNKKDATFGIIPFLVRYSVNDKLFGSPIQLECTISSRDGSDESLTSFFLTPMDAVKANKYHPNSAELPLNAPCFTASCNVEGSLIIECAVKRHVVTNPHIEKATDPLVCLAKPLVQNSERIYLTLENEAAVSVAKKLRTDFISSRNNVLPAIKELFSLTGLSSQEFNCLKYYALYLAAQYGGVEALQYFIEKGMNMNIVFHIGTSPLHETILDSKPEIGLEKAKLLVKHGADIHAVVDKNCSLLHATAQLNDKKWVNFFLLLGLNVNAVDGDGYTPLHCAAVNKTFGAEVTQLLLDFGANPDIRNAKGQTPLDVAIQKENVKVKDVLTLHLAN